MVQELPKVQELPVVQREPAVQLDEEDDDYLGLLFWPVVEMLHACNQCQLIAHILLLCACAAVSVTYVNCMIISSLSLISLGFN